MSSAKGALFSMRSTMEAFKLKNNKKSIDLSRIFRPNRKPSSTISAVNSEQISNDSQGSDFLSNICEDTNFAVNEAEKVETIDCDEVASVIVIDSEDECDDVGTERSNSFDSDEFLNLHSSDEDSSMWDDWSAAEGTTSTIEMLPRIQSIEKVIFSTNIRPIEPAPVVPKDLTFFDMPICSRYIGKNSTTESIRSNALQVNVTVDEIKENDEMNMLAEEADKLNPTNISNEEEVIKSNEIVESDEDIPAAEADNSKPTNISNQEVVIKNNEIVENNEDISAGEANKTKPINISNEEVVIKYDDEVVENDDYIATGEADESKTASISNEEEVMKNNEIVENDEYISEGVLNKSKPINISNEEIVIKNNEIVQNDEDMSAGEADKSKPTNISDENEAGENNENIPPLASKQLETASELENSPPANISNEELFRNSHHKTPSDNNEEEETSEVNQHSDTEMHYQSEETDEDLLRDNIPPEEDENNLANENGNSKKNLTQLECSLKNIIFVTNEIKSEDDKENKDDELSNINAIENQKTEKSNECSIVTSFVDPKSNCTDAENINNIALKADSVAIIQMEGNVESESILKDCNVYKLSDKNNVDDREKYDDLSKDGATNIRVGDLKNCDTLTEASEQQDFSKVLNVNEPTGGLFATNIDHLNRPVHIFIDFFTEEDDFPPVGCEDNNEKMTELEGNIPTKESPNKGSADIPIDYMKIDEMGQSIGPPISQQSDIGAYERDLYKWDPNELSWNDYTIADTPQYLMSSVMDSVPNYANPSIFSVPNCSNARYSLDSKNYNDPYSVHAQFTGMPDQDMYRSGVNNEIFNQNMAEHTRVGVKRINANGNYEYGMQPAKYFFTGYDSNQGPATTTYYNNYM